MKVVKIKKGTKIIDADTGMVVLIYVEAEKPVGRKKNEN